MCNSFKLKIISNLTLSLQASTSASASAKEIAFVQIEKPRDLIQRSNYIPFILAGRRI